MMQGNNRADAIYAVVSARPGFADLTPQEKLSVQTQLRTLYSADTTYIQTNAEVQPGSLISPAGQPVATAGGPTNQTGATTAAQALQGLGQVR